MSAPRRVHIATLGCRLNEAEAQRWAFDVRARGHLVAETPADADILVVNSCAVTREAERKSKKLMRRLKREAPDSAELLATGCFASLATGHDEVVEIADRVIDNADKDTLIIGALDDIGTDEKVRDAHAMLLLRGRSRAFVKVQDGCRHKCTYCIVTVARGAERSKSIGALVDEVNALAEGGVGEIVLAGVHVGGYGSDTGSDLFALVNALLTQTDMPRIRFASVEPWDLHEDFFSLFASPRVMPHLHLPLQSGADAILKRMARRCRLDDFRQLLKTAKSAVPHFNVTTDVIVGFPGESDAHFAESEAFVREMGFGHVHVFPFSARAGTAAAAFEHQVPDEVKKDRTTRLIDVAAKIRADALAAQVGRHTDVLVERGRNDADGYSDNFFAVRLAALPDAPVANVLLTGVDGDGTALTGEVVGDATTSRVGDATTSRVGDATTSRVGDAKTSRVGDATTSRRLPIVRA